MKRRDQVFWFADGIAFVLSLLLFLDVFGVLPTISAKRASELPILREGRNRSHGLLYVNEKASFQGYTLVSPRRRDFVYLLDWRGRIAHRWKVPVFENQLNVARTAELTKFGTLQSKLLPTGHLLVGARDMSLPRGGFAALFELDWESRMVWKYENKDLFMHQDFERFADGRTAVIVQEDIPNSVQQIVRREGGVTEDSKEIFSDAIIEIDEHGREVWRWSAYRHLDPNLDENRLESGQIQNFGADQISWAFISALKFVEKNPINGRPAYIISLPELDTIAIVERETGKIIWREGGRGLLAGQNSIDVTDKGTIIAFDNGVPGRRSGRGECRSIPASVYWLEPFSCIVEIDPKKNGEESIIRVFSPGPHVVAKAIFYTSANGTVQALPGGNILVSAGNKGRVFEIDGASGRVVWDYASPFGLQLEEWPGVVVNPIFSAYRYPRGYAPYLK